MSDLTLTIKFTDAGLAAVAAAHGQGLQVKITHVAVGDVGYVPSAAATALHNELARVALTAGGPVAPQQVLLQGMIPAGGQDFFIRELGYFLEDGTLLGIWSDPVTPLGWIGGATPWFFKLSFAWTSLPSDAITVIIADDAGQAGMALDLTRLEAKVRHTVEAAGIVWDDLDETQLTDAIADMLTDAAVPDATTAVKGKMQLATRDEVLAGAAVAKAVTPGDLAALIAAIEIPTIPDIPADIPFIAGYSGSGAGKDLTIQVYGSVKLARAITIQGETGVLGLAGTGADVMVDIERNGVSVYTIRPRFAAGSTALTAGVLDAVKVACAVGDVLTFRVVQKGSTIAGQQLRFTLKAKVA